jgi:hypothetical protein
MAMSVWKMIKPSEIGISNPVPQKTEIVNHTLLRLFRVELRLMSDHDAMGFKRMCHYVTIIYHSHLAEFEDTTLLLVQ